MTPFPEWFIRLVDTILILLWALALFTPSGDAPKEPEQGLDETFPLHVYEL